MLQDLREIGSDVWQSRDLLFQLTSHDIRIRYKQAVMGFAEGRRVGVDVESHRLDRGLRDFLPSVMCRREQKMLASVEDAAFAPAFYNCWTRKEAIEKGLGLGPSYPVRTIDLPTLPPDGVVRLSDDKDGADMIWTVKTLDRDGFTLSAAISGAGGTFAVVEHELDEEPIEMAWTTSTRCGGAMTITQLLASAAQQGVELWVEGTRLRFRAPRAAMSADLRQALVARRTEVVRELRARAAADVRVSPMSHNQRALWFIAQGAPDSAAYNLTSASRILSPVDTTVLREALQALTDRHPMLRTTYVIGDDGQPVQRTVGAIEAVFDIQLVPGLSDADLRTRVEADCRRPFDLAQGPIFRTTLYTRGPEDHVIASTMHHIAGDAWSQAILAQDFRLLQLEAAGAAVTPPPRSAREYRDFVAAQEALLTSAEGARLAKYWQEKLCTPVKSLDLPSDRPRPAHKSFRGATLNATIDAGTTTRLRELARTLRASINAVLFAALDAMLYRLSGVEDLVVGTPILGRNDEAFSRVVGYFANPVPIRIAVQPGMSFRALVDRVRQSTQEALDHQNYPLSLMVQQSNAVRDPGRSPLFETFFTLVSIEQAVARVEPMRNVPEVAGPIYAPFPIHQLEGQFDLALSVIDGGSEIHVEFKYSTDLFDASTADGMLRHYLGLVDGAIANADAPLEAMIAGDREEFEL